MQGIPEAILKMLAQKMTPMAEKCSYNKCSSYFHGYSEATSIGMNIAKQIVLTQIYIFIRKLWS